ncbi:MAG: protoporphyrinogen oxidase HemJ [Fimbriimonadaceae bacterium]|nr:protoporphyrinogen oxidase HemJ [Chitinophagales bacterium]
MSEAYPYILASHIIFIVTWFAGLFYIVRLFIYHTEALQKQEPGKTILSKQFEVMEKRLLNIITTPSMILVLITGICLLTIQSQFLKEGWMHTKLFFVVCLIIYHFYCIRITKNLQKGVVKLSSQKLRMFNELSTVFLVAIVFLIQLKDMMGLVWGLSGLVILVVVLMLGIRLYKKYRNN